MTKLALILAIHVGGIVFAVLLGRWLLARETATTDLRRVAGAVGRASDAFLRQQFRLVALVAGALALGCFALHAFATRAVALGRIEAAFWAAVGLLLGAGGACLVARVAVRLAQRASVSAASAANKSLDRALSLSVRAGGAAGLLVETLSAIGLIAVFGLLFAMKAGGAGPTGGLPLISSIAVLLPGYAFGAAAAALILQRAGGTYHAAADVGADLAGESDAGLEHDDARNPAIVADLVGDHVGATAGRSVDLFVVATAANVTALLVAVGIYAESGQASSAAALAMLPLVVRAFGVIASAFGVMVVRVDEQNQPAAALFRGQAASTVITLGGLAGASIWVAGEHWQRFFGAGALGVLAATLAAHLTRWRIDRRVGKARELGDSLKHGFSGVIAHGLGIGLESAAAPLLAVGLAMTGAWQLGHGTGLPGGAIIASLTALMTMLAVAPYVLALGTFGAIADNARGVLAMSSPSVEEGTERRAVRLDDAGFVATSIAQTYLITVGCLTALSAAAAVPWLGGVGGSSHGIDLSKPAVIWSGALGFALVLAYAGNAARAASRGARGVALEVERQLRGFPRSQGIVQVPRDYTPSYRACIEVVSRAALERSWPALALALLAPALLALIVKLSYRSVPGLALEALSAFVAVSAITGLGAALAVDGARSALGAARRGARARVGGSVTAAAAGSDAIADVMGNSAGPAAHLLVKVVAATALITAPFLS